MAIISAEDYFIEGFKNISSNYYRYLPFNQGRTIWYQILFLCLMLLLNLGEIHAELLMNSPVSNTSTSTESKTINVTSSGYGETKDAAISSALREALERAYGVFISSSSQLSDDDMVNDEITSISKGYVKSYSVLFENRDSISNSFHVIVDATLSLQKLRDYATSKGHTVSFDGKSVAQSFIQNKKIEQFNKDNELRAVKILLKELNLLKNKIYDYKIIIPDPVENGDKLRLTLDVVVSPNEQFCNFVESYLETLNHISAPRPNYHADDVFKKSYTGPSQEPERFKFDSPSVDIFNYSQLIKLSLGKLLTGYNKFRIQTGKCPVCGKSGFTSYDPRQNKMRSLMIQNRLIGTNGVNWECIIGRCSSSKCGYDISYDMLESKLKECQTIFNNRHTFYLRNKESVDLLKKYLVTYDDYLADYKNTLFQGAYYIKENGTRLGNLPFHLFKLVGDFKKFNGNTPFTNEITTHIKVNREYTLDELSKIQEFTVEPDVAVTPLKDINL